MKAIVLSAKSPIRRPSLRRGFLLIPLLLACVGLAPTAQAVGPDTDGAIPGSNNGEGLGVLVTRTAGVWNTGTGFQSLNHLTGGNQNTATGVRALTNDTNGGFNTATGVFSLFSNTIGFFNSATGAYSLANNISGTQNTANGYGALYRNTANGNTATGFAALYKNTTGTFNTANGYQALFNNIIGNDNTAVGLSALQDSTADGNTAVGSRALQSNTTGSLNTAMGAATLVNNVNGHDNTGIGLNALFSNTAGNQNTALGRAALGASTGSNNTAVGFFAGSNATTGDNNVYIGAGINGVAGESDACRIASIFGQTAANGSAVFITSGNKLGTDTSSRRFKEAIRPMDKASEELLALKPVTFRYKKEIDPDGRAQFGLVAEEVQKVNPDLVVRDKEGKPYSVRYDQVNAMLLNEFLKEHRTVQELRNEIAALTSTVKEQAAQIQKVSAQIEVSKPAPRTVLNK
jgi:trimeric autotransporter adhesin